MRRFQKILVGVDLSRGDKFVAEELSPATRQAVEQAVWLASINQAQVCFCNCLELPDSVWRDLEAEQAEGVRPNLIDDAYRALQPLVHSARGRGISAEPRVICGKTWVELIRLVLAEQFDLVAVGTHGYGTLQRVLFGSTAMKLLRKCPCPVWVTRPHAHRPIASILVAHDLSPVGAQALELGCSMAELNESELHVLHTLQFPPDKYADRVPVEEAARRIDAARDEITRELQANHCTAAAQVHVVSGEPSQVILEYLQKYNVELLVMGTVARSGIRGVIVGNTAERLLPLIPCSVLAVKPSDFVSPLAAPG